MEYNTRKFNAKVFVELQEIAGDITEALETISDASEFYAEADNSDDREQARTDAWSGIDDVLEAAARLKEKQEALGV